MDDGDNVIVINAKDVVFTGRKWQQHVYYRHTGHPGGIRERRAFEVRDGRFPDRIIRKAVERMMPEGPSARSSSRTCGLRRFRAIRTTRRSPEAVDVRSMNRKNVGA